MDPQQQTPAPVKKVLVKRVKVLVKRPAAATPAPAAAAPVKKVLVKVPVKRPVQPAAPAPAPQPQAVKPAPQPSKPAEQPRRPTFAESVSRAAQTAPQVKKFVYDLPKDILGELERREKVTDKLLVLYVYARIYSQQQAKHDGYAYPQMMVELPEDVADAERIVGDVDDDLFFAILDDFHEMAPFIPGFERVVASRAPLEQVIQTELNRIRDQETLSPAQQLIIAYLTVMVDMQIIQEKLRLKDMKRENQKIADDIRQIDADERAVMAAFVAAIERKHFPVNAKKLIKNYFTLSKKDPEKAYKTLTTNPLFFSPILMEKMPKKFFGLVKPNAKDAMAVNKRLGAFLKNLKV